MQFELKKPICCVLFSTLMTGCAAVPRFDVTHEGGQPSLANIVDRIECELVDMVKHDDFRKGGFKTFLLSGDYVTTIKLTLQAEDTGELTPSLNFPTVGPNLVFDAGFKLSGVRKHTMSRNMRFSFVQLHDRWQRSLNSEHEFGRCPGGINFNLEGELGIKSIVAAHFSAPTTGTSSPVLGNDEFSGAINFTYLKNINSTGPKWTLTNFVGPGKLLKAETKSLNKLEMGFAMGSVAADRTAKPTATDIYAADQILREFLVSQINN